MNGQHDRRLLAGLGLILVLLAINAAVAHRNIRRLGQDGEWVAHSHEVLAALEQVATTVTEAETGQRGFLITGEERYLAPYERALANLSSHIARVESLTRDNPAQQTRISDLRQRVDDRVSVLASNVALRREQGFEAARASILRDDGLRAMERLRSLVAEMEQAERDLLTARRRATSRAYSFAVAAGLLSAAAGVAAVGAFGVLLNRFLRSRAKAAATLQEQKDLLQTTLTSVGDGMIATDAEARVTFLNPIAQTLTGWTQAEAEGAPLTTVFRIVNEDTRQAVENPALRALREGVIVGLANHTVLIAKDGTERPIDDSAAPIRDGSGNTRGAILVFRDISERKAAETAVRQSEDRFDFVRRSSGVGFWYCDLPFDLLQWDDLVKSHFHLPPDATVTIETFYDRIHPEDREPTRAAISQSIAERTPYDTDYRTVDPATGAVKWIRALGRTFYADDGSPARFDGVTLDVTVRKQAEQKLRESERRLRTVLESITDAFFGLDREWRFTYVNREAERLLGRTRDDLVGKGLWEEYAPAVGTEFDRGYRRAMEANETVTFEAYYPPHDRWYEVHAYPSPDGLAVYFRDATERREAADALRRSRDELEARVVERTAESERSKRFLETILENVHDGVVACDANGVLTLFNRATREFHGLPLETLPAERWAEYYDLFRPDGVTRMPRDEVPLFRALAGERVEDSEMVIAPKAGPPRTLLASGRAFRDEQGRTLGAVVSMHDVTARKRAEEALRSAYADLERRVAERTAELADANAALRAGEARKSAILETSLDCIITIDRDGHVVDFNPAAERTFGRSRAEVLGKEMAEFVIPPAFRDAHRQGIARYLETGEGPVLNRRVELIAIRDDGTEFPVEAAITPIPGDQSLFTGHLRDITERKHAEAALRASEERFRTLAEAVPQIVWVARPDGWHEFFNLRWYEYTGLTAEQSIGLGWSVPLHPDDRSRSEARWQQATDTGEPYEIEYRFRSKEGLYRWFLGRALPMRDESGEIVRWFGTCTDIDDAKRAEEKVTFLADASAHLAELLDYRSTMQRVADAGVGTFADWITVDLLDGDGVLRRVAATHADRAKAKTAEGLLETYPPRTDDAGGIGRVLHTGEPELMTDVSEETLSSFVRDEGHRRLLRQLGIASYLSVPLSAKGRTVGVLTFVSGPSGRRYDADDLVVAEDLGRRVAVAIENVGLYEALKEADRRKTEFLAVLAHELRNPLAPIRMGLEVLRMAGDEPAMRDEMLGTMEGQVRQMVRLIDDLLDVSRITRGTLELRRAKVELADVLKSATDAVRPMIADAGHRLTVSLPDTPLLLDGDPSRLAQVFSNLLNNATKYTPEGGEITLATERQGSDVVVSVRDSGIGIPPEMLTSVFEMFTQVDRTMERSHSGLGIGLHLVKRLVELHGGSVEARSEGTGRGSEFLVRLPLVVASGAASPGAETGDGKRSRTGRRLLVADDNRDAADLLSRVLRIMGHEVATAADGQEAVAVAESFRPEVCLLDIGMPRLNGYDAARAIRREPWGERMVLVALTGWGQEEDRRRSREAGFDHHLVKPVEPAVLQDLLAGARPASQ